MPHLVDVLIPTYERPASLAVTLACLVGQSFRDFRVVVSDQTVGCDMSDIDEVRAVARVLAFRGNGVDIVKHDPPRGLAEQRQFLLDRATAPYVLFLDDDTIVEPDLVERLVRAIDRTGCGFVGSFVNAPSAIDSTDPVDQPPDHLTIEFWDMGVAPEVVRPGAPEWERWELHLAAHLVKLGRRLGLGREDRLYKVAWVGGCVLFDRRKLVEAGGFSFWQDLPDVHVGEDALAQLRVQARFGGAGLFPSGAWHQEVQTTCPDRTVDAPRILDPLGAGSAGAGRATDRVEHQG